MQKTIQEISARRRLLCDTETVSCSAREEAFGIFDLVFPAAVGYKGNKSIVVVPAEWLSNSDREAQTKDAAFAVSSGIIHQIKDVQIPVGGPVISLVFQR